MKNNNWKRREDIIRREREDKEEEWNLMEMLKIISFGARKSIII